MTPDNRLRFPAPPIDFATEVGLTGQAHEDFPAPGAQPRWDWLLMWFVSLLANQASYDEPTQYRDGTIWFDLNTSTLKIRSNSAWVPLSDVLSIGSTTLSQWYSVAHLQLSGAAPEVTFSGNCENADITLIPIPLVLQTYVDLVNTKPFVYINGLLVDPRNVEYQTIASVVLLNGVTLSSGDTFTVVLKNITPDLFHVPDVVV